MVSYWSVVYGISSQNDVVSMEPAASVDANKTIGMTVVFAGLDLEEALSELAEAGFDGVEVFVGHLGPRVVEAPVLEAHASAAGDLVRDMSLYPSTLNCICGEFDPFTSDESLENAAASLARYLCLASVMGSQRVLIWDGELHNPDRLSAAPALLSRAIERAREIAQLREPPEIAVELHPNTFALKYRLHEEVAESLLNIGAGVCLDFCHAAVALGPDFATMISQDFLLSVAHVHFADSDCKSEQLHFPPGAGNADIDAAVSALAGRGLGVAWDLFGWPAPRQAVALGMDRYRAAVASIGCGAATLADADGQ